MSQDSFEIANTSGCKTRLSLKRKSTSTDNPSDKRRRMEMPKEQEDRIVERVMMGVGSVFEEKVKTIEGAVQENTARLDVLEKKNKESLDVLKEEIKSELSAEIQSKGDTSYNMMLAQQVNIAEKNLMVFGMISDDPPKTLQELGKKIGMKDEALSATKIVNWYRLGKNSNDSKPKPICFILGSDSQRNLFLEKARNLDQGVSFDRDVPLPYRLAYKKFKAKARKQKQFLSQLTRVSFAGHILQLKVRNDVTENWRILEEFIPPPNVVRNTLMSKGNASEGGDKNAAIPVDAIELAKRTVRIGNFPKDQIDKLVSHLTPHIKSPLAKKIGRVSFKNGAACLVCEDSDTALKVCKLGKDKPIEYEGKKLWFDNFDGK